MDKVIGFILLVVIGVVFSIKTFDRGHQYSKFEQVAVKHCMKTMNQECGIATCTYYKDDKYVCEVPYINVVNETKIESKLIFYCSEKNCE